ncbi:P-loop containing nucleoside triphosphate hydrolase protein [Thelephora terrestris]|uniref:P-loop containing nucleoside triphosphate hydrolase protein n=1 Tax=Thelephora terrestris TaxID=56493 RepID=A0A9P6H8G5_9AGAM|nr:P-loop containing nucleoside triphosphate hydrolase protein [Thelephora terrestris]
MSSSMYARDTAPPSHPSRAQGASTKSKVQQQPVPLITIAVMGATGSGKTSFINMASGSSLRIGSSLESCTAEVQLSDEFVLDRRPVVLIDTPGFDDTNKSDTDILKLIAAFLATAYEAGSTLAGVIYIYRISDKRFSGIAARNFKMFRELCGDKTLKNVIFVTNMWGEVPQDVGEARERELATTFFKPVLDKGAQLVRHANTVQSAHDIIRSIMKNKPAALQIQRELVDEHKNIVNTSAGEVINKELNDHIRRHQAELKAVQEDMMKALKEKDEETRQELEAETRKLQEQMNKMRSDSDSMASNYLEEKKKLEEVMKEVQEQARKDREKSEAAYRQQMDDLNRRLQETANSSAAEREAMQQRIGQLQHQWDTRPKGGGGCLIM